MLTRFGEGENDGQIEGDRFLRMSEKILANNKCPNQVVAALLRMNYAGKLEPGLYRDIASPPERPFREGNGAAFSRRVGFSQRKREDARRSRRSSAPGPH